MKIKLTNMKTGKNSTLPNQTQEMLAYFFVNACGGGYSEDQTAEAMRCFNDLISSGSVVFNGYKMEIIE